MSRSAVNELARHGRHPKQRARTRMRILGAVIATLAGLVVAGPSAAAIADTVLPAGSPDLSAMNLAVGDLPPGATVGAQRYVRQPGAVAAHERTFAFSGRAMRRSGLVLVDGEVSLFSTASDASGIFGTFRAGLRGPASRATFAHLFARELGVRAKNVHVGKARDLPVVDAGLALPVTVVKKRVRVTVVVAVMVRNRVFGQLTMISTLRARPALQRAATLIAALSDHIGVGLSPHSTSPPVISGPAQVGAILDAGPGAWSDATKPTALAYQWQRCDATGAACAAIPGATATAYTVAATDGGATLRIAVTATNAAGAATATSDATQVIP